MDIGAYDQARYSQRSRKYCVGARKDARPCINLGFDDIRCAGATDRAMAPEHYRCRHHVYSREKRRRQRNSREFGAVGFKQTCNLLLRAQHHQAFRSHHQPLPKPSLVVLTILADIIHIHSPQFTIFIQVRSWLLQC